MKRFTRIGLIIVGVLLLLLVIISVSGGVMARRPFPQTDGFVTLPGLKEQVEIYRDNFGVPHIYAQNEEDLFFAQGYVHAQDRFWQMEFWRHIGQGRIAEIAGESAVEQDKFIRTVGFNRIAQSYIDYYEKNAPDYMRIMDAYSAGVNAYIQNNGDSLGLQFDILGLVFDPWEIEPWEPVDTVAWGVVMSWDLGGNWRNEITRAQLYQELGEAMTATVLPGYPYATRPVIAPTADQVNKLALGETAVPPTRVNWQRVNTSIIGQAPANGFALGGGEGLGSNNWVVGGDHTTTGLPLLANDPHLSVQMPSIWYEVGLHAPGWDVRGFSFAGVPGVIVGHNDRIAWGVTNVGPDVQDLYIEKLNPSSANQYEYMGEWQEMEVIEEIIKVNGGADVPLTVRITRHGPIINDVVDDLTDPLALRWTAQEPSRILQSVTLINQAQNYEEFREALRYWDIPSQNFIYADVDGNIAYQAPSLIPIRANSNGLTPVPGWTGEHEWEGFIPYDELPALFNPSQGYIVTANHAVVDEEYPHFLNFDWADGDRGLRIEQMIQAKIANGGKISAADFATIHFDGRSLPAEAFVPLLQGLSSDNAQAQAALERLRGWDLQETVDSVPATLFEIFYTQLQLNLLADEVGEDNVFTITGRDIFMFQLADDLDSAFWDNVNTPETETAEIILRQSVEDAVDWLAANVGGSMNDWTWGKIHTITFADGVLGASGIAPVEAILNRGPFPVAGGLDLVNANNWSRSTPAIVRSHPSMRMIIDMSNFANNQSVIPTGQSGHPFNAHYDDQMPLWLAGQYHPMVFARAEVETAVTDLLVLRPSP
ncbi:MAG: penicillin acylase family protein [Chloroflexi bacterium]|nr:penicillin acylase family protein [Chloroflexota bacterium]